MNKDGLFEMFQNMMSKEQIETMKMNNVEQNIRTFKRNVCDDGSECHPEVLKSTKRKETVMVNQECSNLFVKFGLEHFFSCKMFEKSAVAISFGFSFMWESVTFNMFQPDSPYYKPNILAMLSNVIKSIASTNDPFMKLHYCILRSTYYEFRAILSREKWSKFRTDIVDGWTKCIKRMKKLIKKVKNDEKFMERFCLPYVIIDKLANRRVRLDVNLPPINGILRRITCQEVCISEFMKSPKKILSNLFVKRRYWTLMSSNERPTTRYVSKRITEMMVEEDLEGLKYDPTNFYLLEILANYNNWKCIDDKAYYYYEKCLKNSPWDWKKRSFNYLQMIRCYLSCTSFSEFSAKHIRMKELDKMLGRQSEEGRRKKLPGEDDHILTINSRLKKWIKIRTLQKKYIELLFGQEESVYDTDCEVTVFGALRFVGKIAEEEKKKEKKLLACSVCKKKNFGNMKRCSRCRKRIYCGVKCQKKDWIDGHKVECKRYGKILVEVSPPNM